jgi:hypothetical protein
MLSCCLSGRGDAEWEPFCVDDRELISGDTDRECAETVSGTRCELSCMTLPFFLPRDFDPASDVPDASCGITDDRCVVRRVTLLLRRVDDQERRDRLSGVAGGLEPSLLRSDVKSCLLTLFRTRVSVTPVDDI